MHTAHNAAYASIHTELNTCIDSDDMLADGAVEKILSKWAEVKDKGYAGLVGLDADFTGNVIGKGFPVNMTETTISGYYAAGGGRQKAGLPHGCDQRLSGVPCVRGREVCQLVLQISPDRSEL